MHVTSGGSASSALKGKGATQKQSQTTTKKQSAISALQGKGATKR